MPTIEELLAYDILEERKPRTPTLDDYFNTTLVGPTSPTTDYSAYDISFDQLDQQKRNAILDFVGQGLWEFTETGLFSVPGLLVPEEMEREYLEPQTIPGKIGAAIGGTAGFIMGAPMKVGARAATALARPLIRKMGKPVLKDIIKKSTKEIAEKATQNQFTTKAAKTIMDKEVGKRLSYLSHKARWDMAGKGVAEHWGKTASKGIDDV